MKLSIGGAPIYDKWQAVAAGARRFLFWCNGAAGGSDSKGRSFFDASVTDSHEPVIADIWHLTIWMEVCTRVPTTLKQDLPALWTIIVYSMLMTIN